MASALAGVYLVLMRPVGLARMLAGAGVWPCARGTFPCLVEMCMRASWLEAP